MKNYVAAFVVVFSCAGFGSVLITQNIYKFQTSRDPAAVRQSYDFTHLQGRALDSAIKERLVTGLRTFKEDTGFGIGLGHFALTMDTGEKVLACRAFDKVTLFFESEGVAVNGEKAQLALEGACEFSNDLARINPLWIPVAKIFGEKPGDGDFNDYERPAHLRFSNIADYWPRQWVLIGLSIHGSRGQISINRSEVDRILGHPFLIELGPEETFE